jgi:hypothetical protein
MTRLSTIVGTSRRVPILRRKPNRCCRPFVSNWPFSTGRFPGRPRTAFGEEQTFAITAGGDALDPRRTIDAGLSWRLRQQLRDQQIAGRSRQSRSSTWSFAETWSQARRRISAKPVPTKPTKGTRRSRPTRHGVVDGLQRHASRQNERYYSQLDDVCPARNGARILEFYTE